MSYKDLSSKGGAVMTMPNLARTDGIAGEFYAELGIFCSDTMDDKSDDVLLLDWKLPRRKSGACCCELCLEEGK
ncbi:MAG: hypothetical protein A3C04_00060 [Candidatus Wildermuthbacteria bacterium RIFCSPHIGHO2_02_FULL_45_25]|uniref:Uncharacterized protein n=1 Tax=Candidatus Wildermuthbacteria bacterium RIFCSPHIGHO2_02_FULL_45_25 TaxID=1802450 RepID=A0A1G2QZU9_9BACT|nr:MAG: hypothetical protein A3C04_00060 [Candidatus Wildermuthbacteria bacterium RIFCSPHIGHO2_02_FULL_45_25]